MTGLLFIALGVALAVLPGPLTIPPVLLGLWIWSTEFAFARHCFERAERKARLTWVETKRHPRGSAAVTLGGLAGFGVAAWAVTRLDLVAKTADAAGL